MAVFAGGTRKARSVPNRAKKPVERRTAASKRCYLSELRGMCSAGVKCRLPGGSASTGYRIGMSLAIPADSGPAQSRPHKQKKPAYSKTALHAGSQGGRRNFLA